MDAGCGSQLPPPLKKRDLLNLGVFRPLDGTLKKAHTSEMARTYSLF